MDIGNKNNDGEIELELSDIKKESQNMMEDLMQVDDMLSSLIENLESKNVDKNQIINVLKSIKMKVGVIEKEDIREMDEEEIARNLLNKLKNWIDKIV